MAGRGLVLLLAAAHLVLGARPKHPHHIALKPALGSQDIGAEFGPAKNRTVDGASFALVEGQQHAVTHTTCSPTDFAASGGWWSTFKNQFRTSATAPRPCVRVEGDIVCGDQQVRFGSEKNYLCGRNEVSNSVKVFRAASPDSRCKVYITKSVAATIGKGKEKCTCQPCRFSVVVEEVEETRKHELWQTTWDAVFDMGLKTSPTRSPFRSFCADVGQGLHSVNIWISGHPNTVTVIKIALLIIVGVLTGGIGSVAAVAVSAGWTIAMTTLSTYNKINKIRQIRGSEIPPSAKATCATMETAKWAVGLVGSAGSLFFPFSEAMATSVTSGTTIGGAIAEKWGEALGTAGTAGASYVAGLIQGVATKEGTDYSAAWVLKNLAHVECAETTNIADEDDGDDAIVAAST